jgi:predicted lipoprotein with Yx(FWY)xxD motif
MRKILWGAFILVVIFIIFVGGIFWWSTSHVTSAPSLSFVATTTPPTPTTSKSTPVASNTTPNMPVIPTGPTTTGYVIDPGSGVPQIVGDNLMLGVDGNSSLGTYLIAYNGETLYTYEKDTGASSTCYAACAAKWPPYIVSPSDNTNAQYGVDANKISLITRADGTLQVAYNDHPLYFYSGDTQETTNGQGFGGVWYVIKP